MRGQDRLDVRGVATKGIARQQQAVAPPSRGRPDRLDGAGSGLRTGRRGTVARRANYGFVKRQKEIEKQRKKDEKAEKKRLKKDAEASSSDEAASSQDEASSQDDLSSDDVIRMPPDDDLEIEVELED
jgi:hypothetical protein